MVCTKEIIFHEKLLEKAYFIFKMNGSSMVRPASSDWRAPLLGLIKREWANTFY